MSRTGRQSLGLEACWGSETLELGRALAAHGCDVLRMNGPSFSSMASPPSPPALVSLHVSDYMCLSLFMAVCVSVFLSAHVHLSLGVCLCSLDIFGPFHPPHPQNSCPPEEFWFRVAPSLCCSPRPTG